MSLTFLRLKPRFLLQTNLKSRLRMRLPLPLQMMNLKSHCQVRLQIHFPVNPKSRFQMRLKSLLQTSLTSRCQARLPIHFQVNPKSRFRMRPKFLLQTSLMSRYQARLPIHFQVNLKSHLRMKPKSHLKMSLKLRFRFLMNLKRSWRQTLHLWRPTPHLWQQTQPDRQPKAPRKPEPAADWSAQRERKEKMMWFDPMKQFVPPKMTAEWVAWLPPAATVVEARLEKSVRILPFAGRQPARAAALSQG